MGNHNVVAFAPQPLSPMGHGYKQRRQLDQYRHRQQCSNKQPLLQSRSSMILNSLADITCMSTVASTSIITVSGSFASSFASSLPSLEDFTFFAQNAASSLANSVIDPTHVPTNTLTNGHTPTIMLPLHNNHIINEIQQTLPSLLLLYAAGLLTSFSPCSLGLLPITLSYISYAAQDRNDRSTALPTLAFAMGLTAVLTVEGVLAASLGHAFGSGTANRSGYVPTNPMGDSINDLSMILLPSLPTLLSSLVSVLMGLQLLELITIPLPSLDFRLRRAVLVGGDSGDIDSIHSTTIHSRSSTDNTSSKSLFDANGRLILSNLGNGQEGNNDANLDCQERQSDSESSSNERDISATSTNDARNNTSKDFATLLQTFLLGGTSALVSSPCATPVLASLLAYLASASSEATTSATLGSSSTYDILKGAVWMLSYTMGYTTPLLLVGAIGGQALVNLQNKSIGVKGSVLYLLGQWVTPLTGGVLIVYGMNGFLVALLGDPSLAGLAPIME